MHPAFTLAVVALAVARATRLITADRITEAPRRRLQIHLWARALRGEVLAAYPEATPLEVQQISRQRATLRLDAAGDPPLSVYLLSCPWCASIYLAAAAAPLWWWFGSSPWVIVPAAALAISYLTGFLASKEA